MGVIRGKYFTPREMVSTERVVGDWKLIDQGNGTWKHEDSGHLFNEASLQEALKMTTAKPADARIAHTPGPWISTVRAANLISIDCAEGTIASVSRWFWGEPRPVEALANAQLIALAPELLARAEAAEADAAALRGELEKCREHAGLDDPEWNNLSALAFASRCGLVDATARAILSTPSPGARILEKLRIAEEALELIALMDSPMGFAGCPSVATKALAEMRAAK